MTFREAVISTVLIDVPAGTIDKAIIDADVDPDVNYTSAFKASVEAVAVAVLRSVSTAPDVSEGQFSIKYDRARIAARITSLEGVVEVDQTPTVNGVKPW